MEKSQDIHGTEDRIMHFCSLFDLEIPALKFDENHKVLLTDSLLAWVEAHDVNLDWLFRNNIDGLLKGSVRRDAVVRDGGDSEFLLYQIVVAAQGISAALDIHEPLPETRLAYLLADTIEKKAGEVSKLLE